MQLYASVVAHIHVNFDFPPHTRNIINFFVLTMCFASITFGWPRPRPLTIPEISSKFISILWIFEFVFGRKTFVASHHFIQHISAGQIKRSETVRFLSQSTVCVRHGAQHRTHYAQSRISRRFMILTLSSSNFHFRFLPCLGGIYASARAIA